MNRSGPLRRLTPLKRTKRVNPVSKKRAALMPERRNLVARLLTERPVCEVCREWRSEHCHEILPRARGGNILQEEGIVCVCRKCHRRIHDKPKWATEMGLLRSQF